MKTRFISVGRLVEEKGSDLLLQAIQELAKEKGINKKIQIDVYGKGYLTPEFEKVSEQYDFVTYHGFQPKKEILKEREKAHYTIMPSRFLETFGLSALDALSVGSPVIGFQKGGLNQFINDDYALEEVADSIEQSKILARKILYLSKNFKKKTYKKESKKMKTMFKEFTWKKRIKTFKDFLPKGTKKILLVSDYNKDIGGIENRLHIVQKRLKKAGYTVEFFGGYRKKPSQTGIFLNLFRTAANVEAMRRLRNKIKTMQPDLIWRHSVHRVLGWLPLSLIYKKKHRQRIMYHDFGLFHPYPSRVYSEEQLLRARSFAGFMAEGMRHGWWRAPLLIAKWISYATIRYFLKNHIDLHLVPSPYMLGIVQNKGYIGDHAAMDVLPHFIEDPNKKG